MKKAGVRAHTGAEVTCTDGTVYPLLVRSRIGYRNPVSYTHLTLPTIYSV